MKNPAEKGKVWEKRRRDKLKDSFSKLAQILPRHDPAKLPSQHEILENATQFVKELRASNSRLLLQQTQADEKTKLIQELQDELNRLILRVKQLTSLLVQAKISIPKGPTIKSLGKRKLKWSDKLSADVVGPAKKPKTGEKPKPKETGSTPPSLGVPPASAESDASEKENESPSPPQEPQELSPPPPAQEVPPPKPPPPPPPPPPPAPPRVQPVPNPPQPLTIPMTFTVPVQTTPTTTFILTPHSLTPVSPLVTRFALPPARILPKPNLIANTKLPLARITQPILKVKKTRNRKKKSQPPVVAREVPLAPKVPPVPSDLPTSTAEDVIVEQVAKDIEPVQCVQEEPEPPTLSIIEIPGTEEQEIILEREGSQVVANVQVVEGVKVTSALESVIDSGSSEKSSDTIHITILENPTESNTEPLDNVSVENPPKVPQDQHQATTMESELLPVEQIDVTPNIEQVVDPIEIIETVESSSTQTSIRTLEISSCPPTEGAEIQGRVVSVTEAEITPSASVENVTAPAVVPIVNPSGGNLVQSNPPPLPPSPPPAPEPLPLEPTATASIPVEPDALVSESLQDIADLISQPPAAAPPPPQTPQTKAATVIPEEPLTTDKISECIARSMDLIDQPEAELMELGTDWGETHSPKSPISPTQMFLSMFPLLPRESIISSETTPQKQSFSSGKSSFYIDSMLPDDHSTSSNDTFRPLPTTTTTCLSSSTASHLNISSLMSSTLDTAANIQQPSSNNFSLSILSDNLENSNPFNFNLAPPIPSAPPSRTPTICSFPGQDSVAPEMSRPLKAQLSSSSSSKSRNDMDFSVFSPYNMNNPPYSLAVSQTYNSPAKESNTWIPFNYNSSSTVLNTPTKTSFNPCTSTSFSNVSDTTNPKSNHSSSSFFRPVPDYTGNNRTESVAKAKQDLPYKPYVPFQKSTPAEQHPQPVTYPRINTSSVSSSSSSAPSYSQDNSNLFRPMNTPSSSSNNLCVQQRNSYVETVLAPPAAPSKKRAKNPQRSPGRTLKSASSDFSNYSIAGTAPTIQKGKASKSSNSDSYSLYSHLPFLPPSSTEPHGISLSSGISSSAPAAVSSLNPSVDPATTTSSKSNKTTSNYRNPNSESRGQDGSSSRRRSTNIQQHQPPPVLPPVAQVPPQPPLPPPSTHSIDFGNLSTTTNNFYDNILPSAPAPAPVPGSNQFLHSNNNYSKTQRQQPFYLPEVPLQNFDFTVHQPHHPHGIHHPHQLSVPPQQKHSRSESSPSKYNYFGAQCHSTYTPTATVPETTHQYHLHSSQLGLATAQGTPPAQGPQQQQQQSRSAQPLLQQPSQQQPLPILQQSSQTQGNQQQQNNSNQGQQQRGSTHPQSSSSHPLHRQPLQPDRPPPPPKKSTNSSNNNSQQITYPQQQQQQSSSRHHHSGTSNNNPTTSSNTNLQSQSNQAPSRPVNWMTDPPSNQPSTCTRTTNKPTEIIPNPFSVSKLVGNSSSSTNNNNSSNTNYCVEGLIRKNPDWNHDFHFPPHQQQTTIINPSSSSSSSAQSSTAHQTQQHQVPQPFTPYQPTHQTPPVSTVDHYSSNYSSNFNHQNYSNPHFTHFDHHHQASVHHHHQHPQQQQLQNPARTPHHHAHGGHSSSNPMEMGLQHANLLPVSAGTHHPHPHHHHQGSSVLNFNLSSIFPEMNDKRTSNSASNNNNSSGSNNNNNNSSSNICTNSYYGSNSKSK